MRLDEVGGQPLERGGGHPDLAPTLADVPRERQRQLGVAVGELANALAIGIRQIDAATTEVPTDLVEEAPLIGVEPVGVEVVEDAPQVAVEKASRLQGLDRLGLGLGRVADARVGVRFAEQVGGGGSLGERELGLVPEGESLAGARPRLGHEPGVDLGDAIEPFARTLGGEHAPAVEVARQGQGFHGRIRHPPTLGRVSDTGQRPGDNRRES